jgi:hypothetical protein
MRRIVLLTTLAAMMAAAMALSGVVQAKPINTKADAKCLAEAAQTVDQPGFNPSNYTFHGGTEGIDFFISNAEQPEVFCGFGGDDFILELDVGDIFLGGEGNDMIQENRSTFYGQEGHDRVTNNFPGSTFYGGEGTDEVIFNFPGSTFVQD